MARVLLKNLFALWQPRPFNLKTTKKKIQNFSFKFNSRLTFLTVCLIAQLLYAEAHTITCESIGSCSTSDDHNDVCCIMTQKTKIPGSSYTIVNPKNGTVQALDFNNNRNIDFLPVLVISVFPNIVEYDARNCSIKSISKENFERLHHLKLVYLQGNQIETVRGDVFDGLNKIEDIDLGKFILRSEYKFHITISPSSQQQNSAAERPILRRSAVAGLRQLE